jgi:hypothetical protein
MKKRSKHLVGDAYLEGGRVVFRKKKRVKA